MRLLRLSIAALFLPLVSACTTVQPPNPPIPANLKSPCKSAQPLREGADMGDLLEVATDNAYSLAECAKTNDALRAACVP